MNFRENSNGERKPAGGIQLLNSYLHHHSVYGYETLQCSILLSGVSNPSIQMTIFVDVVLQDYVII